MTDGLAKGVGLHPEQIDLKLGVLKGFYMTRVGGGPFPTELGGFQSSQWCLRTNREKEAQECTGFTVNEGEELRQGIALRMAGNEYGATTGRPRRVGWLDLPLLRHALQFNGRQVVLTKLDVLNECVQIRLCTHHYYSGPPYRFGDMRLLSGDCLETAIPAAEVLSYCQPFYRTFEGWQKSLKGITSFDDLPEKLRVILDFVIAQTGINPRMISIGPDREETILV